MSWNKSIEISPYHLNPSMGSPMSEKRSGAFIRFEGGVTDLFPWPEYGEGTLVENISELKTASSIESLSFPLRQVLEMALTESRAKTQGISIRNMLSDVQKNYPNLGQVYRFLGNLDAAIESKKSDQSNYSHVTFKIKMRGLKDLYRALERLDLFRDKSWIWDWNGSLSYLDWKNLIYQNKKDISNLSIVYMEDPFLIKTKDDLSLYQEISQAISTPFALDMANLEWKSHLENRFDQGPAEFLYVVAKPLREPLKPLVFSAHRSMRRVVVSNGMGSAFQSLLVFSIMAHEFVEHPLLFEPSGLTSFSLWEDPWGFSKNIWLDKGGSLEVKPSASAGWGLDSVWEELEWIPLRKV